MLRDRKFRSVLSLCLPCLLCPWPIRLVMMSYLPVCHESGLMPRGCNTSLLLPPCHTGSLMQTPAWLRTSCLCWAHGRWTLRPPVWATRAPPRPALRVCLQPRMQATRRSQGAMGCPSRWWPGHARCCPGVRWRASWCRWVACLGGLGGWGERGRGGAGSIEEASAVQVGMFRVRWRAHKVVQVAVVVHLGLWEDVGGRGC